MLTGTGAPLIWSVLLAAALVMVLLVLWWSGVPFAAARARLQERFLWGVPWGTIVVVAGLFLVYLVVQRGLWHWDSPVVVAYTAVSMWDPVGWGFAGFSHASPGHLRGNVTTTLVIAPIVEWIWGHYPRDRSPSWARRPGVRAIVLFPLGIAGIGVIAALFSWGPVIGFSVAAYALIGIALVHYPVLTLLALVARSAVRLVWRTVTDPVQISRASVQVVEPSWYGSAVQGHLVGLLLGVLVGIFVLRRTPRSNPSIDRVFMATTLVSAYLSLWAIWWILGPGQYILFRSAGVILVLLVALLVALSISDRDVRGWPVNHVAIGIILIAVVGMGIIGIGLNLAVSEPPPQEPAHTVEDYEIYYGENVPDGMVNIVDLSAFGLTTDVETSGVIVTSDERQVWRQTVSASELATHGTQRFHVGGPGWSEPVYAIRQGWQPIGNDPVYQVWIGDGDSVHPAFTSDERMAQTIVEGHSFIIGVTEESFSVTVEHNGDRQTVDIPETDSGVDVHDIELYRAGNELYAVSDGTVVPIASRERYN